MLVKTLQKLYFDVIDNLENNLIYFFSVSKSTWYVENKSEIKCFVRKKNCKLFRVINSSKSIIAAVVLPKIRSLEKSFSMIL